MCISGASPESVSRLLGELAQYGTYYLRLSRFSLQIADKKGLVFQVCLIMYVIIIKITNCTFYPSRSGHHKPSRGYLRRMSLQTQIHKEFIHTHGQSNPTPQRHIKSKGHSSNSIDNEVKNCVSLQGFYRWAAEVSALLQGLCS